jgi:hypothetical protein
MNLKPTQRAYLEKHLSNDTNEFPKIIAQLLVWLHYPIDRRRFLSNIYAANLMGRPFLEGIGTE